ncbi:MAG: retropepsin-like aspartic protease family protein [Trichormus sp.]
MINANKRIIKTINLALIPFLPTLMFLALPYHVTAEYPGECFMINASGRIIKLEKLCGVNSDKTTSPQPEKTVFRVPIKRRLGRTPVIDVTLNNKKTVEMIVDTGANNTLITMATANALQLKTTGIMTAQIADGSQIQLPVSTVQLITAGEARVQNIEVAIAPKAPIGLLGNDFFGHYDIKILATTVEFHPR